MQQSSASGSAQVSIDKTTLVPGATGESMVDKSIDFVDELGIFPSDNGFLKRVAHVESKFGADKGTYRPGYNGGIWQVDKVGFEDTKDTKSHPSLGQKIADIKAETGIDWNKVKWEDLKKPVYSALAARLLLSNKKGSIPKDVKGQAKYWKDNYNSQSGKGSEDKFINDVKELEG